MLVFAAASLASSAASAASQVAVVNDVNRMREARGLPSLPIDPAATKVAEEMAAVTQPFAAHAGSSSICDVCQGYFSQALGAQVWPQQRFVAFGGQGEVAFAELSGSRSLAENLGAQSAPLVLLDPRARALAVATARYGYWIVGAVVDPEAPFTKPVLWPAGERVAVGTRFVSALVPPSLPRDRLTLRTRRAGRFVQIARSSYARDAAGAAGARIATIALGRLWPGRQLAYGTTYGLAVGDTRAAFRTVPLSSWMVDDGFRWDRSVSQRDRDFVRRWIARGPRLFRRIVAQLDGAITIRVAPVVQYGELGHAAENGVVVFDPSVFRGAGLPDVVYHELGHEINYFGLDPAHFTAVARGLHQSPRWRCFPDWSAFVPVGGDRPCVLMMEVFADQVAYWADPRADPSRHGGRTVSGYGDPPLLSGSQFEALLRRYYAPYRLPASANS